jgi:hypothetical protein
MKFTVALLLTALLSFICGLYIPYWWFFAIATFLVALLVHQRAGKAFLSAFLAIFILWGGLAWWIDIKNESILSSKVAVILPLGGSGVLLILVTAFLGAVVAGFAALSGSYLRASRHTHKL